MRPAQATAKVVGASKCGSGWGTVATLNTGSHTNAHGSATFGRLGGLMGMKQTTILMVLMGLLLLATSASAMRARQKTPSECPRAHARTLAANSQAEMYEAYPMPGSREDLTVYGCSFQARHSYAIGETPEPHTGGPGGESGVVNETLAGTIVAYSKDVYFGTGGGEDRVFVRDMRDGRVLHDVPTGTPAQPELLSVGIGPVAAIVAKDDGSVAWIVETGAQNGTYQVHVADKTGSRVLASSPTIDSRSLALAGSTLYWTQGGKPSSATLN
jgi:hypothetical protein